MHYVREVVDLQAVASDASDLEKRGPISFLSFGTRASHGGAFVPLDPSSRAVRRTFQAVNSESL